MSPRSCSWRSGFDVRQDDDAGLDLTLCAAWVTACSNGAMRDSSTLGAAAYDGGGDGAYDTPRRRARLPSASGQERRSSTTTAARSTSFSATTFSVGSISHHQGEHHTPSGDRSGRAQFRKVVVPVQPARQALVLKPLYAPVGSMALRAALAFLG